MGMASNGVIHVIDKVLIPEGVLPSSSGAASNTIVDVAVATDATSTLVAALQAASADVINSLSGPGPFTVFAPTNDAFAALPEGVLDATTLNGQSVELRSDDDGVTVNDATVVIPDVMASNGVIHVIDKVLIPEGVLPSSSTVSDPI